MKKQSIILISALVALLACTKSKEVHPEIGDGNDEIMTVGMKDVHVEYTRTNHAELSKVVFHYCPTDANGNAQQFAAAEMTKKETFFELTLNDLFSDTLYWYYYELFPNSGDAFNSVQKTFHTQACDTPEPPEPPVAELPTVVTEEVTGITAHSVSCIGEVINDGGAEVTERGVCWSTNENPTLEDNHVAAGMGTGPFTAIMNGLEANTTYHVRAYATNEAGTAYGLDMKFTTLSNGGSDVPEGAINGLFTINENGDQVYFSQGNLQYQASTNTWRFAENQWDYVGSQIPGDCGSNSGNVEGSDNHDISENYSGWIDLYCWATSGFDHGATFYHPWNFAGSTFGYNAYGGDSYNYFNMYDQTGQADWGYNAISNGGSTLGQWRTLRIEEWDYIINMRNTDSGIRFVRARVNEVNGVILIPDGWISSVFELNNINQADSDYGGNTIDESEWRNTLQHYGAIFLPAGGMRQGYGPTIDGTGITGNYWSSSCHHYGYAYCIWFSTTTLLTDRVWETWFGYSVRLVQDANK